MTRPEPLFSAGLVYNSGLDLEAEYDVWQIGWQIGRMSDPRLARIQFVREFFAPFEEGLFDLGDTLGEMGREGAS